jgi:integrase
MNPSTMEYGVRPGEARALQKDCLADGNVIIRRAFSDNELRETTKTGRIRIYQITANFQTVLDRIQPHLSPFVFVRDYGKPYTSKKRLLRSRYHLSILNFKPLVLLQIYSSYQNLTSRTSSSFPITSDQPFSRH